MEDLNGKQAQQTSTDNENEARTLEWLKDNGSVWCQRCGAAPRVSLEKIDTQLHERLTCECGEEMTFIHPAFGAVVSLFGVMLARDQSLSRWQRRPSGVRRWPSLARLFAAPPRRTVEMWTSGDEA